MINIPKKYIFFHNFGLREEAFLQDLYNKVKNAEITIGDFVDVLLCGANYNIDGLTTFIQS